MPKVRIILVEDYEYDYDRYSEIVSSITDWEEVTEEEFDFLRNFLYKLKDWPSYSKPKLLRLDDQPISYRISNLRETMKETLERVKKEEEKKKATVRKAAETRRKKLEEKEKAELERLKKKYGA